MSYTEVTTYGHHTVPEGERATVVDKRGNIQIHEGPKRMWLWGKKVQQMRRTTCCQLEYLTIRQKDGKTVHVQGPASIYFDPLLHEEILVHSCWLINSCELLVVYCERPDGVVRRIVRGPAVFAPEPNEWVHQFCWHGSDPSNRSRKIPNGLKFNKLWTMPDQLYHTVNSVRTRDDALMEVKVMIFFELANVELMLEQTSDPVGDFINACTTDVVTFISQLTYEDFIRRTAELNELSSYPSVTKIAQRIGYLISRVVYLGYLSPPTLQHMHNDAIEKRTKLKLNAETEEQEQKIADTNVSREMQRNEKKHQCEEEKNMHHILMERMQHDARIAESEAKHTAKMESEQTKTSLEQERVREIDAEEQRYLTKLKELGVDVSKVLIARQYHPGKTVVVRGLAQGNLNLGLGSAAAVM